MMTVRRTGTASVVALIGLALIVATAHTLGSRLVKRLGLDIWNLPDLHAAMREADSQTVDMDEKCERMSRELEAADHIATRLIERTMTLVQATNELEPMLEKRPGFDHVRENYYRVPTVRQAVACYVIAKVERILQDDPSRSMAVAARLQSEYILLK